MKPTCFVLMPFDEDFQEVYDYAIKPAAESLGFICDRADHALGPRAIIRTIIEGMFSADVLVADVTDSNPNVFYELGVAHTIGNKTIVICKKTEEELPFDLASYRVIFYRGGIQGIKNLRIKLEGDFAQLGIWNRRSTNPVQDFRPVQFAVPLQDQAALEHSINELQEEIRVLRKDKALDERRRLILSLRDIEIRHLRNLARDEPFIYEKRIAFIDELRKLRSLKLIKSKPNTKIGDIPASGDLKEHVELDELTREVLEELFRRFAE